MNLFPIGGKVGENTIILERIKPFVEQLIDEGLIENYHFLMEPEIRFRLFGNKETIRDRAVEWLNALKSEGLIEARSDFNDEYTGEEGAAGVSGQNSYYAYMKAGTDIAFVMRGKTFEHTTNFYHYRGFHFVLNSCGFDIVDELTLYLNDVLPERISTYREYYGIEFQYNKQRLLNKISRIYAMVSQM